MIWCHTCAPDARCVGPEAGIEPDGGPAAESLHRDLHDVVGDRAAGQQDREESGGGTPG